MTNNIELIEVFNDYLEKLSKGLEIIINNLQEEVEFDYISNLTNLLEGLQWMISVNAELTTMVGYSVIDEAVIIDIFKGIYNYVNTGDLYSLGDYLEFEVKEVISQLNKINK